VLGTDGVLAGSQPGSIVAVHSTISIETLHRLADAATDRRVALVDAAVTGGADAAARGELAVLLGGDAGAIEALRPGLASYASMIVRVGVLGAGMKAKIALNLLSFGKMAAAYEGMRLAHHAGVDLAEFARIVQHSEAQSGLHSFYLSQGPQLFG